MDSPIIPYKVNVPDSKLDTLKAKLDATTWPASDPVLDNWDFGPPITDVKRLAKYWRDGFDWRAQEAKMNELPQFTTKVPVQGFGDVDMHFVYKKSEAKNAVPLAFVHGWPGSFIEVTKVLPLLLEEGKDGLAFDVVAPSLPNFGFSDGIDKPGFTLAKYAEAVHNLMLKLGYDEYVTQGGDWGFSVTRFMALLYPDQCRATHMNMLLAGPPSFSKNPFRYLQSLIDHTPGTAAAADNAKRHARTAWFDAEGYGYNLEQSTKPATIGLSLADSPVGLLSWIYEKLHDWTDSYPWTDDEILTWVSIYLFSKAGAQASARIYYEARHGGPVEGQHRIYEWNGKVKIGWSLFPKELHVIPDSWARTLGPIVHAKKHETGGHFAAWENPRVLVGDMREMFGKGGGAADVVDAILSTRRGK